jgi:hypothetical protein
MESPSRIFGTPVTSAASARAGKRTGMSDNAIAGRNFMRM